MADTSMEWLTDEGLEDLLTQPGMALVVFMAQWCPPCQALAPRLDRLASRYPAQLGCYLIDADQHPASAQKYGVRGLPTLVLFMDGDLEATRVGALDDDQLNAFIDAAL
ncbi:thioredoxin family protein [Halomonas sp. McH1-25]|uniref:thioredoxin family protein n=1 Tax=unclassified Halomonas TaxID=2609666 RepID=UPI001EF53A1F|nr:MULTISPECIES: thioredoxin family protein [unclassified Halomonas]MCG7601629.1 thioredoxin family protein [Halomonas sp. McH1-25]MCP1342250.1 thioredoxin family protein [Halomonas sp. FL8]MCP1360533.1 thioredoxin family protein [Halomonas sp. BBD45]MCP1365196.1 thioredoxin family protein [Halomonas sp. BBD48]